MVIDQQELIVETGHGFFGDFTTKDVHKVHPFHRQRPCFFNYCKHVDVIDQ